MLLDITDYLLHEEHSNHRRTELYNILDLAGSVWRVGDPGDHLERRVPMELTQTYQAATTADDLISEHLASAWRAAWGRNTNASEAYQEAVKALEAALAPIVAPKHPKPTLGTIISNLHAKPGKWRSRFGSETMIESLTCFTNELWKGHSRHTGMESDTLEEAQDAVTIAVAIVALVRRGFLECADE